LRSNVTQVKYAAAFHPLGCQNYRHKCHQPQWTVGLCCHLHSTATQGMALSRSLFSKKIHSI